jgi:hypothetical protein
MAFQDGTSAALVYETLFAERLDLQESIDYSQSEVGGATSVAGAFSIPCAALDNYILNKIDTINQKKSLIVQILTTNYNNVISAGSTACGIGTIGNISSNIVRVGSATTFNYNCNPICSLGGRAEVRQDVLYVYSHDALDDQDTNVEFPDETYTITQITTSNVGLGKTNVYFNDQSDPLGLSSTSTLLGYYYPVIGTGTVCTQIKNQVSSLESEIITIRGEISGIISGVNILKSKKVEQELAAWYDQRGIDDGQEKINGIDNLLTVLSDNETLIQDYESSLS